MGQSDTNTNTQSAKVDRLDRQVHELVRAALDPNSRNCYERAWRQFESFCEKFKFQASLPIDQCILLRFISYLFEKLYASSTICSTISALVYFHTVNDWPDPRTKKVHQALLGIKNLRPAAQGFQPLSLDNVNNLLQNAERAFSSSFTASLFRAMASLAFYALLRVGEFTYSRHTLRKEDVALNGDHLSIRFKSFKHSGGVGVTQAIPAVQRKAVCPVHLLDQYLTLRGGKKGYLFVKEDGEAPSRKEFLEWLKAVLSLCNLDVKSFNTHSFRSGMATHMALRGFSGEQIKLAGRWSSDAYRKYIRVVNC